jgi:hypothetical protein
LQGCNRSNEGSSIPRILIVVVGLALGSLNQGCSPSAGYQRSEQPGSEQLSSLLSGSFEACWHRNTIVLGSQSSPGAGVPSPLGGGRGGGAFPLIVRATIMDSLLVEAGIQEFGRLAGMDSNKLDAYRRSYRKHHDLDKNVFVYAEIQTFLAEEYLEAGRWIFFVENQQRNQTEPVRIVPHAIQRKTPQLGPSYDPGSPVTWLPVKRTIELYFPPGRFTQVNRPREGFGTLKFVVLDINNSSVRAEGIWDLTTLQQSH